MPPRSVPPPSVRRTKSVAFPKASCFVLNVRTPSLVILGGKPSANKSPSCVNTTTLNVTDWSGSYTPPRPSVEMLVAIGLLMSPSSSFTVMLSSTRSKYGWMLMPTIVMLKNCHGVVRS
eukprot:752333-Rhodomonas_salina.1